MVVVFPEPLGPRIRILCRGTSIERSLRSLTRPKSRERDSLLMASPFTLADKPPPLWSRGGAEVNAAPLPRSWAGLRYHLPRSTGCDSTAP